jgi:hypothetical protein
MRGSYCLAFNKYWGKSIFYIFLIKGLARTGTPPPEGFMSPKSWDVLARYYRSLVSS